MSDDREKWIRARIVIVGATFGMLFLAVTCQAFRLQILQHDQMLKKADNQHQRVVQLTPARGAILDRNGTSLAVSVEMESCYARPKNIRDMEGTAAVLAPFLGVTQESILKKLKSSKNFVWLERCMEPKQAMKIKNLKLQGIGLLPETKRYYPNSEIAAHVIGFTGVDPVGLEGLELKYNSTILGNTGYIITERDALGRDISLKNNVVKSSSPGKNLILTLDNFIQHTAEKELAKAVIGSKAKNGIALVMESDSGRILAMANYPTFNPNVSSRYNHSQLRNRAVADSFEPGSTFKIFLVAAALEEKLLQPNEVFNCEWGTFKVADRTIHDTHKFGRIPVSDILKHSSNIGAAKIGFRLGDERYSRYLKNFGFGEKTGIDLPGEATGNIRSGRRWYGVDLANISFGQGVTASAIQLVSAVSAVANGGNLMKPYIVERILDDNGQVVQQFAPQSLRRVISEDTSRKITRMLETVTTDGGTGINAAVEGFRVAGKTGTSQKPDPVTRGYSATKRTASFIGYIPADKPKLTILVVVDEPTTSPYGGIVAAPAFRQIAQSSLGYLKIMPKNASPSKESSVITAAKAKIPTTETLSEGEAFEPDNEEGSSDRMPDFRGMSIRQVLQVMEKQGINIRLIGSGKATGQNPTSGQLIKSADEVWVKFKPAS
ncbi:MAG: penicillin-binding protein [Geobacteraceae bacterium GWC2_48_7]|nr:MAG: penicillin-binding protein [Geobacteraceae bacterium GWC2_48_7]